MRRYIDEILQDFEDPMTIQILVMGKIGVGKSTLVNALIGEYVSETADSMLRVTNTLVKGRTSKNGILINICDTPGLDIDLEDDNTLQYTLQECGKIDLFLFCMRMTDKFDRMQIEQIKTITRIYGRDIWKKALFVLTFANTYKPDQKKIFDYKLEEWTQVLKRQISNIIGPELGNKVPVIPAGHEAPDLPDRASWISELWIQGFKRMGFRAMVKLYKISQDSATTQMKLSQEMYTTPKEQQLITCYMTAEEATRSKNKMHTTGIIFRIVGAIAFIVPGSAKYGPYLITIMEAILGEWTTAKVLNYFGWNDEEEIVNCHEEAIVGSLILAFIEEYPEYVNDDAYKFKDELDFNNEDKAVKKEEL